MSFVVAVLIGVGGTYFLGNNYIVQSENGIVTLKKAEYSFSPIILDVSDWGLRELVTNSDIVMLFIRQNKLRYLPGGENVASMLSQGSVGIDKLKAISSSGVKSFKELDKKYDAQGTLKSSKKALSKLDKKYDISGKTDIAIKETKKAARDLLKKMKKE